MRTVYLLRHGEVDFGGIKRCIGRTDLPLSERGKKQAARLGTFFDGKDISAVYAGSAQRTRLTAELLSRGRWPVRVWNSAEFGNSLAEIDMGDWEGLGFSEIRERFPELYAQRGRAPETVIPPMGETPSGAQARSIEALKQILSQSEGNIIIVGHSGINRLLICYYRNIALHAWMSLPQPYGCINILRIDGQAIIIDETETGRKPDDAPDEEECMLMLREKKTPEPVIDHCRAVAEKAMEIAGDLVERGFNIDSTLVYAGAMLHDIARSCLSHALTGSDWLRAEGYPRVAGIIAGHEDPPPGDRIDETAVVCLADKLVLGTAEVTLEERFACSLEKCQNEAARRAHEKRFRCAVRLQDTIMGERP